MKKLLLFFTKLNIIGVILRKILGILMILPSIPLIFAAFFQFDIYIEHIKFVIAITILGVILLCRSNNKRLNEEIEEAKKTDQLLKD